MILIFTRDDTDNTLNKSILKMLPLGAEIIKSEKSIGELNLLLDYIKIVDWSDNGRQN
ncbi:MAG: hypothetical protein WC554_02925 [Clostridia bacterium]|jgi:hypothetical protein